MRLAFICLGCGKKAHFEVKMKQLKPGFSAVGLLAVALVMLPNVLYLFLSPPNDVLANSKAAFWLWNVLENLGRFGLMLALIFIVNTDGMIKRRLLFIMAACFLASYYTCWTAYFLGITSGLLLIGLAVFPTVFFLLAALLLRNMMAVGFSVLFGILHISITANNFL